MGVLESVIGGVLGQVFGGGRGGGHGQGGAMSPLVKALLMLLLAKGASGGLGDIFGGGHREAPAPGPRPAPPERGRETGGSGDIGGYDQWGGRRDSGAAADADPSLPGGGFDDLSGMLDGPGDGAPPARGGRSGGGVEGDSWGDAGRGADGLGGDPGSDLGGLDGLVDRFRRGGLGDVIDSWIGHGANRPVQSDQLARALGDDTVDTLQHETGMDRGALLAELSRALPEVVHALTPEGRVPGVREQRGW